MQHLPPLSALRAFEAAGRLLSFTLAAEELGLTQSAISRQIRTLEDYLQVKLFTRMTRSVALTASGEAYFRSVSHGLSHIQQATVELTRRDQHHFLNLSCLPTLATKWVIPRLVDFSKSRPEIEVRLSTTLQPAELVPGMTDFAIRVGNPSKPRPGRRAPRIDLTMVKGRTSVSCDFLFPDILVAVCSPSIVRRGARLSNAADLRKHTLIHNSFRPRAWPDWLKCVGAEGVKPKADVWLGHFFMTIQAACEGQGIALVPHVLVAQELKSGLLVMPLKTSIESEGGYYLLHREEDENVREHRLFRTWLQAEAEQMRTDSNGVLQRHLRMPSPSVAAPVEP